MRYLWHAFLARPDIPLLRLPWNALAVAAAAVAGFWDPVIWGVAFAGEMTYLLTMASNPGFQNWIHERRLEELRGDSEQARRVLQSRLGGAARQRYRRLMTKQARLEVLYNDQKSDDLFADANRDALRRLSWLYLNLLVGQRDLSLAPSSEARDLQKQISLAERELAAAPSEGARASIDARLRFLRERFDNISHRETSMAEIEADLSRIETQLDFALEEATLRGRPTAISSNVELTSRMLTNLEGETTYSAPTETER